MTVQINRSLFRDKSTLILREMLDTPDREWKVRDFVKKCRISIGLISRTLSFLDKLGFVERVNRGRIGYTRLIKKKELLELWIKNYDFSLNKVQSFYSPDEKILEKVRNFFREKDLDEFYALTLHTGANFITSYMFTEDIHIYLNHQSFDKIISEMQDRVLLKQLVRGGNVNFVYPYYRNSVFHNVRKITKYRVVSNLQLYLDLYNFAPRGREHGEYLRNVLERKGATI
ncbi:MAG: type IV toxin-antitoxin system AbiEi family antitoxin [Thermodesulfobacteriota bacterium]